MSFLLGNLLSPLWEETLNLEFQFSEWMTRLEGWCSVSSRLLSHMIGTHCLLRIKSPFTCGNNPVLMTGGFDSRVQPQGRWLCVLFLATKRLPVLSSIQTCGCLEAPIFSLDLSKSLYCETSWRESFLELELTLFCSFSAREANPENRVFYFVQ